MSRSPAPRSARALFCILVLAASRAAPAAGQEVLLRPKYEVGAEMVYRSTFTSTVDGGAFSQNQTMVSRTRQRVLSVAADGSSVVRVTTEALRLLLDGPMGRMEYDSEGTSTFTGPFASMTTALADRIGESQEMTYSRDGGLVSTEIAGGVRTPDDIMGFPEGPVRPGAEWERESTVTLPPGSGVGAMKAKSRYRLREVTSQGGRRIAVIEVSVSGSIEQDPSGPAAGMLGSLPLESTGEIHFDVERGLVVRSTQRQTATMTVMGESMTVTSDSLVELLP